MLSARAERRLLQIVIAIGGFVPVGGGISGAFLGLSMLGGAHGDPSLDSHIRYLSGLLLGIGLAFWDAIPSIEMRTNRIRLLSALVVLGGLMRLIALVFVGRPGGSMLFALGMELVVTPLVCLWQTRIARRFGTLYL